MWNDAYVSRAFVYINMTVRVAIEYFLLLEICVYISVFKMATGGSDDNSDLGQKSDNMEFPLMGMNDQSEASVGGDSLWETQDRKRKRANSSVSIVCTKTF